MRTVPGKQLLQLRADFPKVDADRFAADGVVRPITDTDFKLIGRSIRANIRI